jgi:glutamate/tyrosine decarboxylase-like PLP-dependent enzyme
MSPARWTKLLRAVPHLSPAFRRRYGRVLAALESGAASDALAPARRAAEVDPRAAGRLLAGLRRPRRAQPARAHRIEGTPLPDAVRRAVDRGEDVAAVLADFPPLRSCAVPIHPDRRAVVVPGAAGHLVAMTWAAGSLPARRANRARLAALAGRLPAHVMAVSAPGPDTVVHVDGEDPWVLAPHHGPTVEDLVHDAELDGITRDRLVATLAELRRGFLDEGWVWQGFAPRNMFLTAAGLVLIDFEECVDLDADPVRAAECLHWHELFFADSLTTAEAVRIFAEHPKAPDVDAAHVLPADAFEAAVLGRATLTWAERVDLIARSRRIEGRHRRPGGGWLSGHALGHFWGDFLPASVEAKIFRCLDAVADADDLAALLEVFETAMEADIDAALLAEIHGAPPPEPARTTALADALGPDAARHLLDLRQAATGWDDTTVDRPVRLADRAIARLTMDVHGTTAAELLVGHPAHRHRHRATLVAAVEQGLGFMHGDGRDGRFLEHASAEELIGAVAEAVPESGTEVDDLLDQVHDRISRYSIAQADPGYLAFPDSGNAVASLAGAALAPMLNQNLIAVDRSAPAATFVTVQVVEWLRELVGYGTLPLGDLRGVRDVAGLPTSGGHMSNHIAMLTALGAAFPRAREQGLHALPTRPVVVMAGPIAHYSHGDAAFHLGLGWDSVVTVPALPGFTTDAAAIERVLADPPHGTTPFMVVGVAGNCRTTGLDDLRALADVCARHSVWFHTDACHGGSLIFDPAQRSRYLAGIEWADSVSLDPHKGLFTPYPSSYVVFRDRGRLVQFSRHRDAVLADGCWDLGLVTPFVGSSAFQALPTWMLLKHAGTRRLGEIVAARSELVRLMSRLLADSGLFVQLNDVDFYRLAFVLCPPAAGEAISGLPAERRAAAAATISDYTARLGHLLYHAGRTCFDEHTLRDLGDRVGLGRDLTFSVLAACPGNPLTGVDRIEEAVDELVRTAHTLTAPLLAALASAAPTPAPALAGPAGWSDT